MSMDKGVELMEPLNGSFQSDPDALNENTERQETAALVENTGKFGIGPKKLAKFADTDGSHNSPPGIDTQRERLLHAKLLLEAGGYDGLAELVKTDLASGIDVSTIGER